MAMIVAATAALIVILIVMVVMLMLVVMAMIVAATAALIVILVVMVVMLMLVVMVMVVAAAATLIVVMMMMMMMVLVLLLLGQLLQSSRQGIPAFHSRQQLLAVQFVPRGRHNGGGGVLLPQQGHTGIQLFLAHPGRTAQNNGAGMLHLVIEELTEVSHIHLGLGGIHHGGKTVQHHIVHFQVLHRPDDIAEFAHTRGFNEDTVGVIGIHHLPQRLAEIAHQTATDAAAVHLGNVDARLLQKAAVNADLAKLIFNEDELLAGIGFCDQLLDEGRFASAQKAGENINFSHSNIFFP